MRYLWIKESGSYFKVCFQLLNKLILDKYCVYFDSSRKALKAGASINWKKVLFILTGSKEIKADALLEYYKPLSLWLSQFLELNEIPF